VSRTARQLKGREDVRDLVRLYRKVWTSSVGIIDLLASDARAILLFDGDLVGYCFVEEDRRRGFAEIQDIAIAGSDRGKGNGSFLLRQVQGRYGALKLTASRRKPRLLRFYKRHGFTVEGIVENYYEVGEDGVRMSWKRPGRGRGR
jgi:ribosomal protein S18 acetylase RimI-like enzyme